MGKKPIFGMVGLCWFGLALAGCEQVAKDRTPGNASAYHANSTFGAKPDATVSQNTTGTMAPKDKLPVVDAGAARNGGSLPDNMATGAVPARTPGMRTPGAAGLLDAPGTGLNNNPPVSDGRKAAPLPVADDGTTAGTAFTTSHAPLSQIKTDATTTPGSTPVALPPPPVGNGSMQLPPSAAPGTTLPPLSLQGTGEARPSARPFTTAPPSDMASPPSAPPLPAGKPVDAPPVPLPVLKTADAPTVHDVPAPAAPVPVPPAPAPKPSDVPDAMTDMTPPAPPPVPASPGSPNVPQP
jgi:hypothetical protein